MNRNPWCQTCIVSLLATAVVVSTACSSKSPEEKIAQIRSLYKARLNGFIIEEEPLPVELAETEVVDVEDQATDVVEAIEEEIVAEPPPVRQRARLDLLIQHDSYDRLPGVTVDISMANSAGEEKGHWRVWFDTADVGKATVTQFTHILEDISYEEGDGFFAEIRNPIPPEERSEYREFSEALGES